MEVRNQIQNRFTTTDHLIVRTAVKRLPTLLSEVMALRFWQNYSILEIADEIGVSDKIVEIAITQAIRTLREECLICPAFSRSLHAEIQAARLQSVA